MMHFCSKIVDSGKRLASQELFFRLSRPWAAVLLAALIWAVPGCAPRSPEPEPEAEQPQAPKSREDQLADRLMDALGGQESWEKAHHIRFTFGKRRTHYWDKYTGRHRCEWADREGNKYLALTNVNTREGTVYRNGEKLEGEDAEQALERAYGGWVNDTYWMIMPYKLRDPGVALSYDGEEEIEGTTYDKLLLTFESVGLTPGDRYWAYLNRDTGLRDRWAYVLERQEPDSPPTQWIWSDWKDYGGIKLASGRTRPEGGRQLPLDDIAVFDELPDSVFTSPEPVSLGQ